MQTIDLPEERLHDFCQQWGIREFALFGSVLRDDFRPDSDVDVLVQFHEDVHRTLYDLSVMTDELELIFGRKVDIVTRKSIENSPNYLRRKEILNSLQVIYAE